MIQRNPSTEPVLTVVVATWNRLPELQTMLNSLLPQVRGQAVEVVVVDDCSTDSTWEWLQTNLAAMPDIRCLRMEENSGPGPARNLGLASARGQYFVPVDSDFILADGAIQHILKAIETEPTYPLLFFPCLQHPALLRLGTLTGRTEISYDYFVSNQLGEMVPVTSLAYMKQEGLAYPDLRAGGESLLWWRILSGHPALFIDTPVAYYRTDVSGRICTLAYQLAHPRDLAEIADAMVALLSDDDSPNIVAARAQKNLAAGTYHLLAGDPASGRRRLARAVREGCLPAVAALAVSLGGARIFRSFFAFYRTKVRPSYL